MSSRRGAAKGTELSRLRGAAPDAQSRPMDLRLLIIASLVTAAPSSFAAAGAERPATIPVRVASSPQERAARDLTAAVVKGLARDPRFRLVEEGAAAEVTISLPGKVGWERRLEWTQIEYQARVTSSAGATRVIAGKCWNWNYADCADQIVKAASEISRN